jgi:hypothetical protein
MIPHDIAIQVTKRFNLISDNNKDMTAYRSEGVEDPRDERAAPQFHKGFRATHPLAFTPGQDCTIHVF